jgi:hypothetical protein
MVNLVEEPLVNTDKKPREILADYYDFYCTYLKTQKKYNGETEKVQRAFTDSEWEQLGVLTKILCYKYGWYASWHDIDEQGRIVWSRITRQINPDKRQEQVDYSKEDYKKLINKFIKNMEMEE